MSDRYLSTPVGFARVNREPLDKYEQFNSLADAIAYAKSGSAYTGQIISVVLNTSSTNDYTYGLFKVNKNRKLDPISLNNNNISFSCNEIHVESIGGKNYALIYYHDTAKVYSSTEQTLCCAQDPYKMSLLGILELFRGSDNNFTFALYNGSEYNNWTQNRNPVTNSLGSASSETSKNNSGNITKLSASTGSSAYFTTNNGYVICPKTKSTSIIELYVAMNDDIF